MRYQVGDEFAVPLAGRLYKLLADNGQPLPLAVGMTVKELSRTPQRALAVATPALFGDVAVGLRLAAPDRFMPLPFDAGQLKMAGFPPEPARLVGRTGVMARSSAALAARSGVPGVLHPTSVARWPTSRSRWSGACQGPGWRTRWRRRTGLPRSSPG
jgi:hypothetical protein